MVLEIRLLRWFLKPSRRGNYAKHEFSILKIVNNIVRQDWEKLNLCHNWKIKKTKKSRMNSKNTKIYQKEDLIFDTLQDKGFLLMFINNFFLGWGLTVEERQEIMKTHKMLSFVITPPPTTTTTQTQCHQYLSYSWPDFNQTLKVGLWEQQQQLQQ